MPVHFTCPKCEQKLTLTATAPGEWLDCPTCDAYVQVPPPVAPDPEPNPVARRAARARSATRALLLTGAAAAALLAVTVSAVVFALRRELPPAVAIAPAPEAPASPVPVAPPPQKPVAPEPPKAKPELPKPVAVVPPVPEPVAPPVAQPPAEPVGVAVAPPPREFVRQRRESKAVLVPVTVSRGAERPLKLGVNPSGYDDVGAVLKGLGKGYEFDSVSAADTEALDKLKKFDVLFLNCGGDVGGPRALTAVRGFVANGGTLYASDLQYDFVARTFPTMVLPSARGNGTTGEFGAEVVDSGLQKVLGKTVDLTFDAGGWQTAAFGGKGVSVLLRATGNRDLKKGAPLLVKFPHGKGTVIYTSFHNAKVGGDTAKKLLRYLVFSSVLADAEARVAAVLARDKFESATTEQFAATENGWSETRTFDMKKPGTFRVAVGFHPNSAELEAVLTSPEGDDVTLSRDGTDTFVFDVVGAPAGEWKVKLTAKKVPHANFPIHFAIAKPK